MTTKQAPTLDERAEAAAAELAEVEAERHRIATGDAERQAAHEARYDTDLIAGYLDRKPDLERAVDDARHALDVAAPVPPSSPAPPVRHTCASPDARNGETND